MAATSIERKQKEQETNTDSSGANTTITPIKKEESLQVESPTNKSHTTSTSEREIMKRDVFLDSIRIMIGMDESVPAMLDEAML